MCNNFYFLNTRFQKEEDWERVRSSSFKSVISPRIELYSTVTGKQMELGDKMETQGIVNSTLAQISGLYSQVLETLLL